jgi:hypothetical protein
MTADSGPSGTDGGGVGTDAGTTTPPSPRDEGGCCSVAAGASDERGDRRGTLLVVLGLFVVAFRLRRRR